MPVTDELLARLSGALGERYQGLEFLARGGMGVVFRAWDRRLGRWVALKTLAPEMVASPGVHERWRREVRAMAAVRHPNVITLFDVDRAAGAPYFTMEYLEGLSLRQLGAQGRLRPEALVAVVADVASGLAAVHAAGMLHRDIKPENVVLCRDGRAVLMDLGLMTSLDRHQTALTATGHVVGTYVYLAPEVLAGGKATPASDLYQLALTLYEGLTGSLPFDAAGLLNWAHGRGSARIPAPEAPGVDGELVTVVLEGLARRPESRCASAAELERRLRSWLSQRRALPPSSAADVLVDVPRVANPESPPPRVEAVSPPVRRTHVVAALVGTALGVLAALVLLWPPRVPQPTEGSSALPGRTVSAEEALGWSPLHRAVWEGNEAALVAALADGGGCDLPDDDGWTPLHLAAGCGRDLMVADLLARGASVDALTRPEGRTPLHLAACGGSSSVVACLLRAGAAVDDRDGRGRTPLHLAAWHGRSAVLGLLVAAGANTNAADDDGAVPLHLAAALGQGGILVELLRNGAWLEARTRSGCTPLLAAARTGTTAAALVLVDEGARVDAADDDGGTALHAAMPQGNLTLVKGLLAAGASPALLDRWGRSALDLARSCGAEDVVRAVRRQAR